MSRPTVAVAVQEEDLGHSAVAGDLASQQPARRQGDEVAVGALGAAWKNQPRVLIELYQRFASF